MRATIKSIAKDLGISHMTVSRALSGSVNVNAATRQTVVDYAQRVGYVKSSAAGVMRGEQTAIVGLLLPNIINEFYARFANHLGLLCAEAGFDLVIHLTNDEWQQEAKLLARLQALQACVVVRVPAPRADGQLIKHRHALKLINLIRTQDDPQSEGDLLIGDGPSIQLAVSHLVRSGRHRIAYIGAAQTLSSGQQRLQAYQQGLRECCLPVSAELICTGVPGYEMGRSRMEQLLDLDVPPDSVVCGGFEISNGALETCMRRQLEFPGQLAFVGYGDPAHYRWIAGGITTIALSEQQLASEAIKMIQDCSSDRSITSQTIATELILRHSA